MKKSLIVIFWFEHLFWMLGKMYINFLKGDFKNCAECYYLVFIHLKYKSNLIDYEKPSFWQRVKIRIVTTFGILFTGFLLYILCKLLIYIIIILN